MEFKELVKNRRSCRSFETAGVSEETIAAILGAGTWAPSPLNMQPWEFLVVTDPRKKAEVRKVAEDARPLFGPQTVGLTLQNGLGYS